MTDNNPVDTYNAPTILNTVQKIPVNATTADNEIVGTDAIPNKVYPMVGRSDQDESDNITYVSHAGSLTKIVTPPNILT